MLRKKPILLAFLFAITLASGFFFSNMANNPTPVQAAVCTPVVYKAGDVAPPGGFSSEAACLEGRCAGEGQSIDAYGACCPGLSVAADGTTCRTMTAGPNTLADCRLQCDKDSCICPINCNKSSVSKGEHCGGIKQSGNHLTCYNMTSCEMLLGTGYTTCPAGTSTTVPNKCNPNVQVTCYDTTTCVAGVFAGSCPTGTSTQKPSSCNTGGTACAGLITKKGACGTAGCAANQKPVYACNDGLYSVTPTSCAADASCTPQCNTTYGQSQGACQSHFNSTCTLAANGCWNKAACSDYKLAAQCNSQDDKLNCFWSTATNSCVNQSTTNPADVCPLGSTPITGGVDAGACRCGDGRVVEKGTTCSTGSAACKPGSCINGKRCEYNPISGSGYVGTHNCTIGNCLTGGIFCSSAEYCDVSGTTPTCQNKLPSGTACFSNGQCASGKCTAGKCEGATTNITCTSDASCPSGFLCKNNMCSQATGTPAGDGTTGSGGTTSGDSCTIQAGQRCGTGSGCCANGGVCQGISGQEVCQIPEISPAQQCAAGGGTCSGYVSFQCNTLKPSSSSNGHPVCEENAVFHGSDRVAAIARASATGCGQFDQVCVGGSKNGHLCGDFSIYNNTCSGTPGTPGTPEEPVTYFCTSPCTTDAQCQTADSRFRCALTKNGNKRCRLGSNPASTTCQPAVGPMCMSISMSKADGTNQTANNWKAGDAVRFTCGTVQGASRYIFRVIKPDNSIVTLNSTGAVSAPYTLDIGGRFRAQCQICTGAGTDTCLPFEDPNSELVQ